MRMLEIRSKSIDESKYHDVLMTWISIIICRVSYFLIKIFNDFGFFRLCNIFRKVLLVDYLSANQYVREYERIDFVHNSEQFFFAS